MVIFVWFKITCEESRQEGKIGNLAIVSYFDAASNGKGGWIVLLIILYFVIQLVWMSIDLIVSFWSINNDKLKKSNHFSNFNAFHYTLYYSCCWLFFICSWFIGTRLFVFHLRIRASYNFQNTILNAVLRARIGYFDAAPSVI